MRVSRFARVALALTSLLVALSAASVLASHGTAGRTSLQAVMTGEQEAAGGDPDGIGWAQVSLGSGKICYTLVVTGIGTPTAAHIHVAPAGVSGPVVVPLAAPVGGKSQGCVWASSAVINAIAHRPEAYYVNVHNAAYPAGAIRGQLR